MTTVTTATSPPPGYVYPPQQQQAVYPPQTQQQVYPPQQQQPQMYPATGYVQAGYPAQPVTFVQVPPGQTTTTTSSSSGKRYSKKAALATGILQIIAGAFAVILGIVLLVIGTYFRLSWNIWGGIGFYIVTGILGVVSKNQNKCLIIAYMVMCIISAVCAGSQTVYDSVSADHSRTFILYCGSDYYYNSANCPRLKAIVALHSISALTAFGEMIVAIVASAFCCHGLCSGSNPSQPMVVTYAQAAPAGMTVVAPVSYAPSPGTFPQGQPSVNVQGQPPAYAQLQQQPPFPEQPLMQEEPK